MNRRASSPPGFPTDGQGDEETGGALPKPSRWKAPPNRADKSAPWSNGRTLGLQLVRSRFDSWRGSTKNQVGPTLR